MGVVELSLDEMRRAASAVPAADPGGGEMLYFNGVDGTDGGHLLPPMTAREFSESGICRPVEQRPARELGLSPVPGKPGKHRYKGLMDGVSDSRLPEAGWCLVFPHGLDPQIAEALQPLIEHRRTQAAQLSERRFRLLEGKDAYRPGEGKVDFLNRHKAGFGPVDPDAFPYYLLLVGSPSQIPFSLQFDLGVQYAVGRLHFETPDEYANYALSVVEHETRGPESSRQATFFGVANSEDPAARLSLEGLAQPLARSLKQSRPGWQVRTVFRSQASRDRLACLLGGTETPSLLFTSSHGLAFPCDDPRQLPHQGAIVCQDWPGRLQAAAPARQHYFAALDVASDARLRGLIVFHYASFSAGTPELDRFQRRTFRKSAGRIARLPFIARLPQRLLGHPAGSALAVIANVDQAWSYSFQWNSAAQQISVFQSALTGLLDGVRVGHAMQSFGRRYAEFSVELTQTRPDNLLSASLTTAQNDARRYVVLGDPAVRLI
ncbi:MAG: hypothetical protein V3T83_13810 [Acidobacteriota bacterium]